MGGGAPHYTSGPEPARATRLVYTAGDGVMDDRAGGVKQTTPGEVGGGGCTLRVD